MKTAASASNWVEGNQRYLVAALAQVSSLLEAHRARGEGKAAAPESDPGPADVLRSIAEAMPAPPALEKLCVAFHLSSFERSVLLLCAGMELDSNFAVRCAAAQANSQRSGPTFGLALAALPDPHWSAIAPGSPLRRWRLIELAGGESLVSAVLRIDERVLHLLAGISELDDRLRPIVEPLPAPAELPASQMASVCQLAEIWANARPSQELPVIQMCGPDEDAQRSVAALACRGIGLQLFLLRHADIPAAAAERETLSRSWEREFFLAGRALLVEAAEAEAADCSKSLLPFLENTRGILLVSRREPLRACRRPVVRCEVRRANSTEQKALWRQSLGDTFHRLNGHVEHAIAHFNLGPGAIRAVSAELQSSDADDEYLGSRLWQACRAQARPRLDDLAQRLEPSASWDDLVLPENQRRILGEIRAHLRQRLKVYETWGFAGKGARGLGISALFAGASGTGKTLAAEVLAGDLGLDLYRIDLSSVISKYIGETEKNLRRVFDAAEEGGAILLFDEADALFGKRSEVKDSHDRYANMEVSYLLQRMECYRGLAILTTNMKDALDPAFLRRLRFVVQFPFPDAVQRAEIWRRIFPAGTPTEGLDPLKLCRLNVAGGHIRNVAMNAAFLAADANEPVRMKHLLNAARSEYAKLEKPLTESEIGGWS